MRRFALLPLGAVLAILVARSAPSQQDMSSRLQPISSPIRHGGVYHVATGTWTPSASLANLVGPEVIYNNTCSGIYFTSMFSCETWQHRSRIPSTSGPTMDSLYYGTADPAHRYDTRPGCQDAYLVEGFQIAYCTSHVGTLDWRYQFASSYQPVGGGFCGMRMVPDYTFSLTGLPGSTSGTPACWTIDIDLAGLPGGGMLLSADGDGSYVGPETLEQFGFSFTPLTQLAVSDFTGPIIAGNFTWTGGPGTYSGVLTPCTGTDGTIWDLPVDLSEPGTGMSSNDFFRSVSNCDDPCGFGSGSCCYYFGGNPHADFHLKLFAESGCPPPPALAPFCFPGIDGVRSCPCGNPPGSSSVGCDNFGPNPSGGTGGARLDATGVASIGADSIEFQVTGEIVNASNLTLLWQATSILANGPPSGSQYGAGVRCIAGTLKRIYFGNASAGSVQFPTGSQPDVHTASAVKGYTIVPPITLHYFSAYRNSAAGAACGQAGLAYNATNSGSIAWIP